MSDTTPTCQHADLLMDQLQMDPHNLLLGLDGSLITGAVLLVRTINPKNGRAGLMTAVSKDLDFITVTGIISRAHSMDSEYPLGFFDAGDDEDDDEEDEEEPYVTS